MAGKVFETTAELSGEPATEGEAETDAGGAVGGFGRDVFLALFIELFDLGLDLDSLGGLLVDEALACCRGDGLQFLRQLLLAHGFQF